MAAWGAQSQGAAGGAATGAASGALMGSMMGPGGTVVGAIAGGLIGGVQGLMGGKAKKEQEALLEAQQRAIQAEETRRAKGVGQVRDLYGVLPGAKEKYRTMGTTLQNRGLISGAVEGQADTAREAGQAGLVDTAQAASAARKGSIATRGLLGSSLDDRSKQQLLGSYLGGKAAVAGSAESARSSGFDAMNQERMGLESAARQGGDMTGIQAGLSRVSAIGSAKSAIPYQAFGSLVGDAMDFTTRGALAYQQGGQGLTSVGIPQPRLGGSVPGAYTPKKGS